jgi:hypothetical protein
VRCQSMRDVLRSLMAFTGDTGEPADALLEDAGPDAPPALSEAVSEAPSAFAPWLDITKIQASMARDVLERTADDRSNAQRREQGWQSLQATKRLNLHRFTFGAQAKAKAKAKVAPKPKAKRERTDETRAYFREYQRKLREKRKADALVNSQAAPS